MIESERADQQGADDKLDPAKAVAAYTRSDAGAGHGSSAILPSDLRTPATLVVCQFYMSRLTISGPWTTYSQKSCPSHLPTPHHHLSTGKRWATQQGLSEIGQEPSERNSLCNRPGVIWRLLQVSNGLHDGIFSV